MIDAQLEDGSLVVSAAPLLLVLDASAVNLVQRELASIVARACARSGARLRTTYWSDSVIHDGLPARDYPARAGLATRGRFFTPVAEAALPAIGSFVGVIAGRVPDWDDWASDVSRCCEPRIVVRMSPHAPALEGCVPVELHAGVIADIEAELETLLTGDRVTSIEIAFTDAVPVDLPPQMRVSATGNGLKAVWNGEARGIVVPLASVQSGTHPRARVSVASSDGRAAKREWPLVAEEPKAPDWRTLAEVDADAIRRAIASYRSGSGVHECPRCGGTHRFENAFRCIEGVRSLHRGAGDAQLPGGHKASSPDLLLIRSDAELVDTAAVTGTSSVWLGAAAALRGVDDWTLAFPSGETTVLPLVWPGLWGSHDVGLWIVAP